MAKQTTMKVPPYFPFEKLGEAVTEIYEVKGYNVNILRMNNRMKITVQKGVGVLNKKRAVARVAICGNILSISCSEDDGEWIGKIVCGIFGVFLCGIPTIEAIVGILRQLSLNDALFNEVEFLAASICE